MSSAESKPPLTSTRLPLPFEQLSPAAFERLCLWLARREGFDGVEYLGQAGSEQGRDLVARRDGRRFAFQCKRVQRFAAADAAREVAKIRSLPAGEQSEELIFVVTKAISAATRKSAREAWGDEETCRFWSGHELDERVKRHPEILDEFFDLGSSSNREPGERPKIEDPEIAAYRAWALESHQGLHLIGVSGGEVKVRLDEVYVPLRISHRGEIDFDQRDGKRRGELARGQATGDVELEEIFSAELVAPEARGRNVALEARGRNVPPEARTARHAVIFGEPGAGKTTALRKMLHHCLTRGPESLGLAPGTEPFFLPLRRLASADLSEALPVFLERELPGELRSDGANALAARLWRRGRLLLLLDGLDEIGDEQRRQEVCSYLEWQLSDAERRQVRAVVSCRYSGYGSRVKLGGHFAHLDVRPLDGAQVRDLVRLWFRQVQPRIPDYTAEEARRAADDLISALESEGYSSQQLKVLVSSPLLLTLLCVVVLRGGEMPRHRVAFYDQCLRVLLGRWGKTSKGREPLLEVETALGVLRPLAWELHAARRRDDLSKAELVNHLRERLRRLDNRASGFRVLDWLHRETGVIEEYAPLRYGFMHLGLQEYLAAAHAASRGEELLDRLSSNFGDRWWREVILLLAGLPGHRVLRPFIERVLCSDALVEHADLLRECLAEAQEVDLEPFLEVLDSADDPGRQAAVLRLLRGHFTHGHYDARLIARAERLTGSSHTDLAALARQAVDDYARAAPGARRKGHELVLCHLPADLEAAKALATDLKKRGVRLFETANLESDLEAIVDGVRGVAVLVGEAGEPVWEHACQRACLELFAGERLPLIPVLLAGAREKPELPRSMSWAPWVDISGGLDAASCEALEGSAFEPRARPIRVSKDVAEEPAHGQPLRDPLTGIELVWVPGGRFQMGGTRYDDEQPVHWVRMSPFWLGKTPVTNRQYGVFLDQTKHEEPEEPKYWRDRRFSDPDQPVVGLSWHEAQAFCEWLCESLGAEARLPSEAQWEYAARGTDGREYPWGNEPPDPSRACFGLDYTEGQPARVGTHPAGRGAFGTLDQAGNVWEWCQDVWREDAYEKRSGNEVVDPLVTAGEESVRVLRGGSWGSPAGSLRAASRDWRQASSRDVGIGFRVLAAPAST